MDYLIRSLSRADFLQVRKEVLTGIGFLLVIIACSCIAFPLTFLSRTNTIIGLVMFPFAVFFTGERRINYVYLSLIIIAGLASWVYHVRIFYFLMLIFSILFALECLAGKIERSILILVLLMSPFLQQVLVIVGFTFRLELSKWAGYILNVSGTPVLVEGNTMIINGTNFTVDDACTGLNMLAISMLMGFFLVMMHSRKESLKLPAMPLMFFFLVVVFLNVLSNLIRIVLLVYFHILPENPMHDVIGIICLGFYVVLPLYFLARFFIKRFGTELSRIPTKWVTDKMTFLLLILLSAALILSGFHIQQKRNVSLVEHAVVTFAGLEAENIRDGVTRISSDQFLLYVKPIPEFFSGEHTPLLCWKGSGYRLEHAQKSRIGSTEVFTGVLRKEGAVLYTSWWYTNGDCHTLDQFDWRIRMLKGESRFNLVNVTANDEGMLHQTLTSIFHENKLSITR